MIEKVDLKDCTFGVNIRFATEDRKRNIKLVIEHLLKYLNTNIIVIEEATTSYFPEIIKTISGWNEDDCRYIFLHSDDEYMGKTKCFNKIFELAKTPIYALHDADVVCDPEMYFNCAETIRNNKGKICQPFDGSFRNVPESLINEFSISLDHNIFTNQNTEYYSYDCPGGSIFIESETFDRCGWENENMKGWGYDDNERLTRYKKLGYEVLRVSGTMYHLNHERTKNSQETEQTTINKNEYRRIKKLTKEELLIEISTWKRQKRIN